MTYTNNINYHTIDYLDLFDDIPFKYVKSIVNQNKNKEDWIEFDFQVEIEDVEGDRVAWCATKFTFDLEINVSNGSLPLWVTKTFVVIKEYNGSSPMAMYIGENLYEEYDDDDEEDEEDEDDDDDDEEEEQIPTIQPINPIFLEEEEDVVSVVDLVI